jgi:hypothetical protein
VLANELKVPKLWYDYVVFWYVQA